MTLPIRRLPEERVILSEIKSITGCFPKHDFMDLKVFKSREEYLEYLKKTLKEEKEKRGILD